MSNNVKNKKKKKGFTLIELIIVIAIIAILAAIAIPKFGDIRKDAAFKSDIANAKTIANAATSLLAEGKTVANETIKEGATGAIANYLQNPPTPKSKDYTQYNVIIDDGEVTVVMKKTDTDTSSIPLFPVPATTAP
ncbi:MAG: prepilin-type N-terminal cleavage/methylation domain-containing protein [Clostridium sartagoforme]|nr:prepilin-type N-terminal cleavage/methylation domain-containing protein [Clostridium sartagoforme]